MSKYIHDKMRDKITYTVLNFNDATIEGLGMDR